MLLEDDRRDGASNGVVDGLATESEHGGELFDRVAPGTYGENGVGADPGEGGDDVEASVLGVSEDLEGHLSGVGLFIEVGNRVECVEKLGQAGDLLAQLLTSVAIQTARCGFVGAAHTCMTHQGLHFVNPGVSTRLAVSRET